MASLNLPFLILTESNFEFESTDECSSAIVDSREDGLLYAYTNTKGEAIFYDLALD